MKLLVWDDTVAMLKRFKIPVADYYSVTSASVAEKAKKLGYPVVLKALSPAITHKTEGGFVSKAPNEGELLRAFEKMQSVLKKRKLKAEIVIQPLVEGTEVIIGAKKDASFGNIITFGLGGIFVEVIKDVTFRVAPVDETEAEKMIREIKGYRILDGYRGKKANIKKLAEVIANVSRLCEKNNNIAELDLNPIMVSEENAVAVDARIIC